MPVIEWKTDERVACVIMNNGENRHNTLFVSSMLEILDEIESIPPLPQVAVQVMHLSRDPECTADRLTDVISMDQALTANLLKLCNSAFYGIPRTISSVKQAIMFLGFHTVRNLVLTSTMREVLDVAEGAGYWYVKNGLWRHSIAVAVGAQMS